MFGQSSNDQNLLDFFKKVNFIVKNDCKNTFYTPYNCKLNYFLQTTQTFNGFVKR